MKTAWGSVHRLFIELGYEATTLRQVAEAADVGFGTVFAYAADKAGLLAMVFVERLKALPPLFETLMQADPLDRTAAGRSRTDALARTVAACVRRAAALT